MMLLGMVLGMFSTSCQDMLSPNSDRHAYTVAQDTLYSYWGIIKSLQNIAERYVILNECRGDLVDPSGYVSDSIAAICEFGVTSDPEKWWKDGSCVYMRISDYYHIINSCNAYIAYCDTTRRTGTNQPYMIKEYAQVQAIRAWVYMQLLYAYGPDRVPFYTQPMLTTDAITTFLSSQNYPKVNADNLARELGPTLERMEQVEKEYGLPQYNYYRGVCHSSRCMFPVSIVLGDLYLLSGKYADAALHYYNYINTRNCGPLSVNDYISTGVLDDRLDYPVYEYTGVPYYETSAIGREWEAITCIPSSEGKLDGRVLTDINRLFGFDATLQTASGTVSLNDESYYVTISDVSLSRNYERELLPSKGYEALCDSQKYEIYVGETAIEGGRTVFKWDTSTTLEELPGVGDARRSWIYARGGSQFTFRVGDNEFYGKMVTKQNPRSSASLNSYTFSTTYPVIYRKSTVWLRYAEALNRAGFPGYAFAILKTGLCENPEWYPIDPNREYLANGKYLPITDYGFGYFNTSTGEPLKRNYFDYPITDSLFYYYNLTDDGSYTMLPEGWQDDNKMSTYAELEAWLTNYFQQEYDDYQVRYQASLGTDEPLEPMEAPRTIDKSEVYYRAASEDAIGKKPNDDCGKACYYIPLREVKLAADLPYLDFKEKVYMRGLLDHQIILTKDRTKLYNPAVVTDNFPSSVSLDRMYTIGVHQRGCGIIRYDDPVEYRSSYNYVTMIGKKLKENGISVSDDDLADFIYDEANLSDVQDAVEDLIIDEAALELAFEGTRFSDLCRVAQRRGPDYLAKRVAKRHTGEVDETFRSWLNNPAHWWLPLPQE